MRLPGRAEDHIGRCFATIAGADEISRQGVRHLLEAMEWDWPAVATGDDLPVPLSVYLTFAMPAYRQRGGVVLPRMLPPLPYHLIPAPGSRAMGGQVGVVAGAPMRVGDRLVSSWHLDGVRRSRTRLGETTFLDFQARFANQHGVEVAVERMTLLSFDPPTDSGSPAPGKLRHAPAPEPFVGPDFDRSDPQVGSVLAEIRLPLTLQRLVMLASANRDFAPIHHDPQAAAEIGASQPVVNTMFLLSFVEQLLVTNGGPDARALRLGPVRLLKPTPAASTVWVSGVVTAVELVTGGMAVDVDVRIGTDADGLTVTGDARVFVPTASGTR